LSGIVPSGAAYSFDFFTNNPKTLFMATTDPRRDPHSIPGELLNLLVHEEYGHCLHASNSANAYAYKPTVTDLLWSPLAAMSKSMVYHQLSPEHQGIGPGYATTYAIIGESIRQIQNKALRSGKKLRDFNSYACSMGFPARTIFEERLRQF